MTIDVLVCRPDGSQTMEKKEVPDDWFSVPETEKKTAAETAAE